MKMIENNASKCCYCGGCVGVCPQNCLELKETKIVIDQDKCVECLSCVKICPVGAMQKVEK